MGKDICPPMTMPNLRSYFLLTAAAFLIATMAQAQQNYALGGLAGSALRMGFGARGMGMANALSAVRSDELTGYYNPALVPFQSQPTAFIAVGFLPLDRKLNFVGYTQHLPPSGGFFFGIINAGVSNIEGRDRDGMPTETYSTSENEFLLSFGVKAAEHIGVGVSTKILYHSLISGVTSTTVGFDIGVLYAPNDELTFGAVLRDINSKYKWDSSQLYGREGNIVLDRFPLRRTIGVGYSPRFMPATIAAEVEWIGSTWLSRIGAEIRLHERFSVRGGVDQISFGRYIDAKPSFGFSVRAPIEMLEPVIHYSYIIEPYSPGGIHMLSVSINFE